MIVLKSKVFVDNDKLTHFVNDNNIAKEDILTINSFSVTTSSYFIIFFYGDSETEEKTRGLWG